MWALTIYFIGQPHAERFSHSLYLFRLQKGALWDFPPEVVIRNKLVIHQTVSAVCFYDGCFIQFIFFWVSSSFGVNNKRVLHYTLKSCWIRRMKRARRKDIQVLSFSEIQSTLTLVAGLATQKLPEVFGCMGVGINSFFDSLDISSSTTKFPLCLN